MTKGQLLVMAKIFEKQLLHYALLIPLLGGMFYVVQFGGFLSGGFWGLSTQTWLTFGTALAILHQVYVWFCWRIQLHYSFITRVFGERAFTYYAIGFSILAIARVLLVFVVAWSNKGSLVVSPVALDILASILLIPIVYLFYSVQKYFTFKRAFGIDHFDPSYKTMPFVREGIFKFTKNGMYTFGVLIVWIPGLIFASKTGLLLALFNHLYVWIHYFVTEKPDIKRIYSNI